MATPRRRGISASQRSEAIRRVRQGEPLADVVRDLRDRFPDTNVRDIQSAARRGAAERSAIDALQRSNDRRRRDIGRLLGCGSYGRRVRIGITVRYLDAQTGVPREFRSTFDVSGTATVEEHLLAVTQGIIEYAMSFESIRRGLANAVENQDFNVQITSAECL